MENPHPDAIRAFVAIKLPDELVKRLAALQQELQSNLPATAVRWTRPEQIHLTLKFLGNVEVNRIADLSAGLRQAGQAVPSLRLRAEGLGFFPPRQLPRVVWVGVHDGAGSLNQLQRMVETVSAPFTREKPSGDFKGHLTIGRARILRRPQAELLAKLAIELSGRVFGEWTAETVELMRSDLSPQGSRHACLVSIALKQAE
ncbi:MAG TPA: RNA 2',3'-cyclic phosphodiesterase [Verrucomicrobiae bacterium]